MWSSSTVFEPAHYSIGGDRPTHVLIASDDTTAEQVAEIRHRIAKDGFPTVLPAGWRLEPLWPASRVTHPVAPPAREGFDGLSLLFGMVIGLALALAVLLVTISLLLSGVIT